MQPVFMRICFQQWLTGLNFRSAPEKSEYLLLDKSQGNVVNSVIFMPPTEKGKGILVTPTVDGNLLAGPTAVDVSDREDLSVTSSGMNQIIKRAKQMVPDIQFRDVITSFAGLRATPDTGDFVDRSIEESKRFY